MTHRDTNDAFFYEDMSPEDRPFCPPLRHDDDPEPFFRGDGKQYFLASDGRIVNDRGEQSWWFHEPSAQKWRPPLNPQPRFTRPDAAFDAAFALFMCDDAWYLGHAYLSFDWRRYVELRSAVR